MELIWVAGVVSALMSVSMIAGNALVEKIMKDGRSSRSRILALNVAIRGTVILAAGILGMITPERSRGVVLFSAAVILYLVFGVSFGISNPVRMAFINRHVPSEQRATVLSFDSLFQQTGGVVGQSGLGYISRMFSIPLGWMLGGAVLYLGYPLYRKAGIVEDVIDEGREE